MALALAHSQSKIKNSPHPPSGHLPPQAGEGKENSKAGARATAKAKAKAKAGAGAGANTKARATAAAKARATATATATATIRARAGAENKAKAAATKATAALLPATMRSEPSTKSEEQQPPLVKGARRQARGIGGQRPGAQSFATQNFGAFIARQAMKAAEPADKPGFVVDSHSSRRYVTVTLKQPTRTRRGPRH